VTNLDERVASETVLPPVIDRWHVNATLMDFAREKSFVLVLQNAYENISTAQGRKAAL
jgi:hypothetical protein